LVRVTRLRRTVWLIPLVLLTLAFVGLLWLLMSAKKAPEELAKVTDAGNWPAWLKQATAYTPPQAASTPKAPERDAVAEELARLRAQLDEQQRLLEELKRRPVTQVAAAPAKPPAPQPKPPERHKPSPMLFVQHAVKEEERPSEPTYTIMPGYFIPCAVETAMNSDTGDITFVAVVTSTVYDTETGRYPLILQQSKIVGAGQGSQLLYGNERLRTVSLSLSRRQDKTPIDLGEAPISDQAGMNGLVSRVDQHFWRLVGAVFIGGALRGGTQAVQTAIAGTGPVGQVGGGIAQTGQQAVTQRTGPALTTRPTIEVDAGQLCHVIVTKPLHLTLAR
jgi:type IV secretory pathway VirB10-like protein